MTKSSNIGKRKGNPQETFSLFLTWPLPKALGKKALMYEQHP